MNLPIRLSAAGKDYLWGGNRLKEEYNQHIPLSPLAEAWVCSVHPDGESIATDGEFKDRSLTRILAENPQFLGKHTSSSYPLLIKLIDAKNRLSVQVHPDEAYANVRENGQHGKTEFWYILAAEPGAELVVGWKDGVTKDEVKKSVADGTLEEKLKRIPVHAGDGFLITPGTVHAIGAGILLAEIQQNSNLTYRLYDYNRRDANGNLRPLHLEKALEVADLSKAKPTKRPRGNRLCSCRYFDVRRMEDEQTLLPTEAPVVLLCTQGEGVLHSGGTTFPFRQGDCFFLPAETAETSAHFCGELLMIQTKEPV